MIRISRKCSVTALVLTLSNTKICCLSFKKKKNQTNWYFGFWAVGDLSPIGIRERFFSIFPTSLQKYSNILLPEAVIAQSLQTTLP